MRSTAVVHAYLLLYSMAVIWLFGYLVGNLRYKMSSYMFFIALNVRLASTNCVLNYCCMVHVHTYISTFSCGADGNLGDMGSAGAWNGGVPSGGVRCPDQLPLLLCSGRLDGCGRQSGTFGGPCERQQAAIRPEHGRRRDQEEGNLTNRHSNQSARRLLEEQ